MTVSTESEENPVLALSQQEQDRLEERGRALMEVIFEHGLPWYQATVKCAGTYEGEQQEWLLDVRYVKTHGKRTPDAPVVDTSNRPPAAVEV